MGHRNCQLGSTADSAQSRPNRLCCLAGRFYAPFSRISTKIFLESLKHIRSPWECLIFGIWNLIQSLLSLLWCNFWLNTATFSGHFIFWESWTLRNLSNNLSFPHISCGKSKTSLCPSLRLLRSKSAGAVVLWSGRQQPLRHIRWQLR